jgi:hypothetical protein
MKSWKGWIGLGVVVLGVGCSATKDQATAPRPTAISSVKGQAAVATPTAVSSVPAGWITYKEPAWGYSISMPSDWHVVTAGQMDPQQFKSFSSGNVTNAQTLAGMDADGIELKVTVSQLNSGCPGDQPPVGWSVSTIPAVAVDIDGYPAVVWGTDEQPVASLWNIQAAATNGQYCYSFVGLTRNHDAQLRWVPLVKQMLSTFRYGTLVAPPF